MAMQQEDINRVEQLYRGKSAFPRRNSWFLCDFLVAAYLGIPFFLVLWLGYKIVKKTKVVPLKECNFEFNPEKYD